MTDDRQALRIQAIRALRQGDAAAGIAAYRALLAVAPADPDDWYNLAYLQRQARQFEESLASYAEALQRGIARPEEIRLNRAVILADHLDRVRDAEAELKLALEEAPGFVLAWLNLGNLYEDLGDREAARGAYAQALALDPSNGRALARIAAIDLADGVPGQAVARLTPFLPGAQLDSEDAVELAFAMANALDAAGDHDAAFAMADRANLAARHRIPDQLSYRPEETRRLIDAIMAAFDAPATPPGGAGRAPIFICGMFRSGSTLVEQILGRHRGIVMGGELEALPALVQTHLQPYPVAASQLSPDAVAGLRSVYLDEIARRFPGERLVTDKRPDNFLHIGLIKTLFPEARIIHTHRHPLDTLVSIYFLHFHHNVNYGFAIDDIVDWMQHYRRLMVHWTALYPDAIHTVDYDALVADPETPVRELLAHCGLPWDEACLADTPSDAVVRTASVWQVRQPLHRRSSGRWRHYARQLADAAQAFGIDPG